jgi:hypothetical protein
VFERLHHEGKHDHTQDHINGCVYQTSILHPVGIAAMDSQAVVFSSDHMNQGTALKDGSGLAGNTDTFGLDLSHEAGGMENAEEEGGSDMEDANSKFKERLETLRELCHQIYSEPKWYAKAMEQKDFLEQQAAKANIEAGSDLMEIIAWAFFFSIYTNSRLTCRDIQGAKIGG